jgi:hypothetical protein
MSNEEKSSDFSKDAPQPTANVGSGASLSSLLTIAKAKRKCGPPLPIRRRQADASAFVTIAARRTGQIFAR